MQLFEMMNCIAYCAATVGTIVLLSTFFQVQSAEIVVQVNAVSGNDSECTSQVDGATAVPCQTIERAYLLIQNCSNSSIVLTSSVTLSQVLQFWNLENVIIYSPRKVTVNCSGDETGIFASGATNFTIINITFVHCGFRRVLPCLKGGSLVFKGSEQLTFFNMEVQDSPYAGIVLNNSNGDINITRVNFTRNRYQKSCKKKYESEIDLYSSMMWAGPEPDDGDGYSKCRSGGYIGGGLNIFLMGNTSNSSINIAECFFSQNLAHWGGGLHAIFADNAANNLLTIKLTIFQQNEACTGGGGLRINFRTISTLVFKNEVQVNDTSFFKNLAKYGSGFAYISTYSSISNNAHKKNLLFYNCTWYGNNASVTSPAVDIVSAARLNSEKYGFLPTPYFIDINITNNNVVTPKELMKSINDNDGVFIIAQMKVFFKSHIHFCNNSPTAILATSGGIIVEETTSVYFDENIGTNGAAIALYGYSYIFLSNNVNIFFRNNKAKKTGAAIFQQGIDQHAFLIGSYCFLENHNENPDNVTLWFDGNIAENGSWIYSQSFLSCAERCKAKLSAPLNFSSVIKCIGDFKLLNGTPIEDVNEKKVVSTSAQHIQFPRNVPAKYYVVPGETFVINYTVTDEFKNTISPLTYTSVVENHSPISFDRRYSLQNQFQPIGATNQNATVDVTVLGIRKLHFQFHLQTLNCSPGFVYNNLTKSCECGNSESSDSYSPITTCTKDNSQAKLNKPYWVGYIPENSQDYKHLYFVPCFPPVCLIINNLTASTQNLHELICGKGRTGVMCGKCNENYSIFYHSQSFACKANTKCKFGPLFYILSEITPVFIVFLIVLIFDLSLTSGNVVGFIFFCQYLEDVSINTDRRLSPLKIPYLLFYGIFNLNYFSVEKLSFCLWKDSHIQDIIFFKYFTVAFAFALVVLQIVSLKMNRFFFVFKLKKYFGHQRSFIHGLSAFLVISYIQCTKTSFFILKYVHPEGLNGIHENYYTYYGGERYFDERHKIYATFAIFVFVVVTILPSLILLLHPFLLQVLAHFDLSEHWCVLKLLKLLCIQKLIPFLDSFQSCYKDKCRMFAGLYFLYRVALLLCFILSESYVHLLYWVQLLLLSFLGVHATIQPYKKKVHNFLDSLIFTNLSVINMLTIMAQNEEYSSRYTVTLESLQIILYYLPMVACIIFSAWKMYSYCKGRHNDPQYEVVEDDCSKDAMYSDDTFQSRLNENSNMID